MAIVTVNGATEFDAAVIKAADPVLVDFWAPWCGPCKMIAPELEAVAAEYEGKAVVVKVNVDENQPLAQKFGIMGIPTMIVFKNGAEVNRIVGFRPKKEIAAAIDAAK